MALSDCSFRSQWLGKDSLPLYEKAVEVHQWLKATNSLSLSQWTSGIWDLQKLQVMACSFYREKTTYKAKQEGQISITCYSIKSHKNTFTVI